MRWAEHVVYMKEDEKCIQTQEESLKQRAYFGYVSVDGRIILRHILMKRV
jgi:hypothetical protein